MNILSVQFYATDSAYCKSFLTRCTVLGGEERKDQKRLLEAVCVFLKSQNNCLVITRHSIQISFPNNLDTTLQNMDLPCSSDGEESACNAGDLGSIPGLGRSPGDGNGNSLQYSCLENPMDRGAWQATICGVEKSQTRLSS